MADLPNVYDYFSPSPIPLEQLVCMEVALILWRREIQQNITESGNLRERYPRKKTSLQYLFPELPTKILRKIERYVIDLQNYIPWWLSHHSSAGILQLDVLKYFSDFVFDFDGSIHYGKTAERFVACKAISDDVKFKMACWYCLEDDILKVWPRVSTRVMANDIDFDDKPLFDYWRCRLTNQPHEVIEELTIQELCDDYNCIQWSTAKYFLNRLSSDIRMEHIANVLGPNRIYEFEDIFFRYMLAKLNQAELEQLVKEHGAELVMYSCHSYKLQIWANIKNRITDDGFCRLVKYILKEQTVNSNSDYEASDYCKLWSSAPNRVKQAAIRDVLLVVDSSHFERRYINLNPGVEHRRSISFLSAALSDTTIKDRKKFWKAHWETLYIDIRPADFRFLIDLCFDNNQNQIISFKNEIKSKYHRMIHPALKKLLENGCLKELEEFVTFWCPNERSMKEVRLMLLFDSFAISSEFIGEASALNEFIKNAFEDVFFATDFKNRFFIPPDMKAIAYLTCCIRHYDFRRVMKFVDTLFAPSDENKFHIKEREIVPILRTSLIKPGFNFVSFLEKDFDVFESFIGWLFESDDEITRFKEALDVNEVIRKLIKAQKISITQSKYHFLEDWFDKCFQTLNTPDTDSGVGKFLKWYFTTPEAVEKFEKKYSYDPIFKRLLL